jgi:uncharacterized protein YyaL (SSP411 family)
VRTAAAGLLPDGELERLRLALFEARAPRPRPATDTKVITSWNALAISAFAQAGAALGDERYLGIATDCAHHLLEDLRNADGRLMRCRTAGRAVIPAMLEDHAFLLAGLLDLYEATFDERWFTEASRLADETWERFGDSEHGGLFTTAADGEQLAARRKDLEDHPIPSGNSTMALALTRLHGLTGKGEHADTVEDLLRLYSPVAAKAPRACGRLLRALLVRYRGLDEVAIVGPETGDMIAAYRSTLRPTAVIASAPIAEGSAVPLLADREPGEAGTAGWVCRDFACRLPVETAGELLTELSG